MQSFTTNLNLVASAGAVVGQLYAAAITLLWFYRHFVRESAFIDRLFARLGFIGVTSAFLVALLGMVISLVYSNVIGYAPCTLCWYQRVFLYPQVFILGAALCKKAGDARFYCLILSAIGGAIAAYHYYGQSFNTSVLPACAATGASCAARYFVEFGYVTLPLMSLTAFILIIVSLLLAKRGAF
ncbi:disulfide bond formation protein B [Patescibacteria group bacterium]|nr:disulfide bond formation protein B [Patescibacteria group bacterium]